MENLTKKDIEQIETNIELGGKGLANIFHQYFDEDAVCLGVKTKTLYIFRKDTKLYDECNVNGLVNEISEVLQSILKSVLEYHKQQIENAKDMDADVTALLNKKQIQRQTRFKQLLGRVGEYKTATDIFHFLLDKYYDEKAASKLNAQENVLPIKNGKIIDLTTGEVKDRTPEHFFTYELDLEYLGRGDENTPHTRKFVNELATGNKAKYDYLKLVLGSAITTDTSMKCFFIFAGEKGNNGKTTLLEIMSGVFTNLSTTLNPHMLFNEKRDKVGAGDFAKLHGKTFAITSEPQDRHCNSEILKLLTGSDSVEGKRLYHDPFTFTPYVKIFVLLNNVIYIQEDSNQIMKQRTRVVAFDSVFVDHPTKPNEYKVDLDLKKKFTEIPAYRNDLFTWLVNGAVQYHSAGNDRRKILQQPAELEHERKAYFDKMDYYSTFLKECCVVDKESYVNRSSLWIAYEEFEHDNGREIKPNAKAIFFTNMEKRFTLVNPKNVKKFKGLRLKTEAELICEGEAEVQKPPAVVPNDKESLLRLLRMQQTVIECYEIYTSIMKTSHKIKKEMRFVESLEYKARNPMDVITNAKNYELNCSSSQETFTQDSTFKIVF
jgi:P4 family phage/plasmid primase-like protien